MEEEVVMELTWDEYKLLLNSLKTQMELSECQEIKKLYLKLYFKRKVIKNRD